MGIAREGFPFILVAVFLAVAALAFGWKWTGALFALFALAFVGFFRDPDRYAPEGDGLVLAPADGRIVGIRRAGGEGAETRISIFLSPLDVHVNRAPVRGKVQKIHYQKGRFLAAYREEASENNERNALTLIDTQGRRLGVVQIAGVLARRIVCYVKEGDALEQGQRFGLIMFGSRVDLFLPGTARIEVAEGQRVRAGESVIGRFS